MTDVPAAPAPASLPVEPESRSEILAAGHIFVVETTEVPDPPWKPGGDGLEHRVLHLQVRLVEDLKGRLRPRPGDTFPVDLEQSRENAFTVSDYHGFWSHFDLKPHTRYLILAVGDHDDPAWLMQEPQLKSVRDGALAADVSEAIQAEQAHGVFVRTGRPEERLLHAGGLLKLSLRRRASLQDLFGGYLWARIEPVYRAGPSRLGADIETVITLKDATAGLRRPMIEGLCAAVAGHSPERRADVLRALLTAIDQPALKPLADRLLQVEIWNLVYPPGGPALDVAKVVPEASARHALADRIGGFQSDHAEKIRRWLRGS